MKKGSPDSAQKRGWVEDSGTREDRGGVAENREGWSLASGWNGRWTGLRDTCG